MYIWLTLANKVTAQITLLDLSELYLANILKNEGSRHCITELIGSSNFWRDFFLNAGH